LGVALLHILPETGKTLNGKVNDFPLSYVIVFIGIMSMTIMLKTGHNHSHGYELEKDDTPRVTET